MLCYHLVCDDTLLEKRYAFHPLIYTSDINGHRFPNRIFLFDIHPPSTILYPKENIIQQKKNDKLGSVKIQLRIGAENKKNK